MNKIFKLLAVLMLFSALSAGSMTVQAETTDAVAQIGSNTYTSLATAIEAADQEAEVEIDLLKTVELSEAITINSNVTLDLNGCTLTTSSNITVAPGGNVVDNSEAKSGLLILGDSSQLNWTSNSQVPVYNNDKGGYVFATMTEQVHRVSDMGADTFKLIFKPDFGAVNELLANGSADAKVSIGINLEWTGANGTGTQPLVYTDDMVKTVYSNSGKAFYIELTGFSNVDNLTITPMVKSELGTTWSETEFNAEVEETVQYTVTFYDEDGTTVLATGSYEAGTELTVPENPTKADDTYTYTFAGWTPKVATTVTADATYTATYTKKQKLYKATWTNGYAVFEAEETALHATNVAVVEDKNNASADKTLQTIAKRYTAEYVSPLSSTEEADFGFEFTAETSGMHYMWVRVATTNKASSNIWTSKNGDGYVNGISYRFIGTFVAPNNPGSDNLSATSSDYGWKRVDLASIEAGETYSVRFLSRFNKTWVDKFIITTDANFVPELDKDYDPTSTTTE